MQFLVNFELRKCLEKNIKSGVRNRGESMYSQLFTVEQYFHERVLIIDLTGNCMWSMMTSIPD